MSGTSNEGAFGITPVYVSRRQPLRDSVATRTSMLQDTTVKECLPLLNSANDPTRNPFDFDETGVPLLMREDHIEFAKEQLEEFPAPFVGIDASRPWMVYWSLLSLYFLGEDISSYRARVISTFSPLQNPSGGFGGGQGHLSHLAGTYAALLSLALVSGDEAYSMIDRQAMWHWLGRLKQSDGGFCICEDGEEDARGAYCAVVAISLLNLPWELPEDAPSRTSGLHTFGDGLGEYLSRCQTYEGGISASPGNEAHGAYAFCAIACLTLLERPEQTINKYIDVDAFLSWLSARQYAPEGGFAGRTNKVVDGCYSQWIGGCWPILQATLAGPVKGDSEAFDIVPIDNLYSTEGLSRYILSCCQAPHGGLRDKPSKQPDSYHTCYTLAGLSLAENCHYYRESVGTGNFSTALMWSVASHSTVGVQGPCPSPTGVTTVHPVYVIPHEAVAAMRMWSQREPIGTQS